MARFAIAGLLIVVAAGCSRKGDVALVEEEQGEASLSSLHVADPRAAAQLLQGWHEIEHGSWRWTQRQFSVGLKAPVLGKPAMLELKFTLPETLMERLHSITLVAAVNGTSLPPTTYNAAGDQVYSQKVPGAVLAEDLVRIDFQLDKALAPGEVDQRELGVIVSEVGLQ